MSGRADSDTHSDTRPEPAETHPALAIPDDDSSLTPETDGDARPDPGAGEEPGADDDPDPDDDPDRDDGQVPDDDPDLGEYSDPDGSRARRARFVAAGTGAVLSLAGLAAALLRLTGPAPAPVPAAYAGGAVICVLAAVLGSRGRTRRALWLLIAGLMVMALGDQFD
ncbi:hypothetical protein [Streptomyces sp. bgisy022]|uniref:hypothetical protein n=1 Tax=Streptomyces sp. bgisy022 TaxID=3413769 RepID=UPI003D725252